MKFIKPLLLSGALFFTYAFLAVKAPYLHKKYLRHSAGSKTVMITKGRSGGSGFFVELLDGGRAILTNKHVCNISKDGSLHIRYNKNVYLSSIIAKYEHHDLCLVQPIPDQPKGFKLASSVEIGENVAIVGHPKLHPLTISIGEYIGDRVIRLRTQINRPKKECNGYWTKPDDLMSVIYGVKSQCLEDAFQWDS